jgi:hypothetical protein
MAPDTTEEVLPKKLDEWKSADVVRNRRRWAEKQRWFGNVALVVPRWAPAKAAISQRA